jgi:methylated-DNA-protein-cysteine methyltransferase-like protein
VEVPVGFRVLADRSAFDRRVLAMVRRVPAGKVASYGRIADWIGEPAAARAVGSALSRCPPGVPAHRIVTAAGRLVPGWSTQAARLRSEGVAVERGHVAEPIPWFGGPRHGRAGRATAAIRPVRIQDAGSSKYEL